MGERERLALFNMINGYMAEARVLDAYAGSGALGIEALSRGAKSVCFVEKNRAAERCIANNLSILGFDNNASQEYSGQEVNLYCEDVAKYKPSQKFDLILADPPYDKFDIKQIGYLSPLLVKGGILVLSHPGEAPDLPQMTPEKSHKYAGATISIFVKE